MPGTRAGGLKAAQTNYEKHGRDFYRNIGRKGGQNGVTGGFAANPKLAKKWGTKGGYNGHKFRVLRLDEILDKDYQAALANVVSIAYGMKLICSEVNVMSPKVIADINRMCASDRWYHIFYCSHVDTDDFQAVFSHLMANTVDEYTRDLYGSLRKVFKDITGSVYSTNSKYEIEIAKKAEKLLISSI